MRVSSFFIVPALASGLLMVGDLAHVRSGTAYYPGNQGLRIFSVPLWVFIEFFIASFILIFTHSYRATFFKWSRDKVPCKTLLSSAGFTLLIYLATSLPEAIPYAKWAVLIFLLGLQTWMIRPHLNNGLIDSFLIIVIGCSFEMLLGKIEVFRYAGNSFMFYNIPLWLPLIYLSASISARLVGDALWRKSS